jgi:hypothetical protein
MEATKRTLAILLSFATVAAVATTLISLQISAVATPTFASGKLIAIRSGEWTEGLQDPVRRAQFISVPTAVLDSNPKLVEVLEGADKNYEILVNSVGYGMPVDPAFDVSITEAEANSLVSAMAGVSSSQSVQDNYVSEYHRLDLENNGKYYLVTIMTVGTQ